MPLSEALLAAHDPPGTLVTLIRSETPGAQGAIVAGAEAAQLGPPMVIVVGEVVRLARTLQWFEDSPARQIARAVDISVS